MRDVEFAQEYSRLVLRLEKYFIDKMKIPVPHSDKALLAEDLVQLTAMQALENSRKPQYKHYSIEKLLFTKAANIWSDYCNPPRKKLVTEAIDSLTDHQADNNNELKHIMMGQEFKDIKTWADEAAWTAICLRQEGYEDDEIAGGLNLKPDNIRQRIHRLREKIKLRWRNEGML